MRPILSVIDSLQHETAKWLAELLQSVLSKFSKCVVKDSFEFNDTIRNCSMSESKHMQLLRHQESFYERTIGGHNDCC